jgi:DNA-binding MarR family transcriptional regulator
MTQKSVPETISYLLKQTCRAHRNTAHKLLAEIGLHAGQEMILYRLWQTDGLTQSELVEQLCVQPATVTKMLNRMVKNGLVERRRDLQDQRVSRVYLTNQGRELQKSLESVWDKLEQYTVATLSLEERVLLRRLLMQVQDNLNNHA